MTKLEPNQYQCAVCHEVFEKGWSDEEAEQDASENFPGIPLEECSLVCDDCFQKIRPFG